MRLAIIASVGLLVAAGPAFAHHPFASEFDSNAPMTLTGKITAIDWNDPHVYFHVDVKDVNGQMRNWSMEAASPETLQKGGWSRTTLKSGDEITVQGYRAKSEPFVMAARMIKLPDGKTMSSASNDGGPKT
jgi:hypothetical protein